MSSIGLLGGSFNPVHHGHLIIARAVAEIAGLKRVFFLPGHSPPHKSAADLAPSQHRAAMVQLAIEGESLFEFSDVDLRSASPCFTYDTVCHFQEMLGPGYDVSWIIGADSLPDLPTWRRADELIDRCRILIAARTGFDQFDASALETAFGPRRARKLLSGVIQTPRIEISSTQIRARLASGLSIRYLTPPSVCDYITQNRLYLR